MDNLYLFYGTARQMIEEKKNELLKKLEIDEFNVSVFDMEETSYNEALADCNSIPFLAESRAVVFKNCYFFSPTKPKNAPDEDFDSLKNYLINPSRTTVAIFLAPYPSLDHKKAIVKAIEEKGIVNDIEPYTKEEIVRYIDTDLKMGGHPINSDARDELILRLQDDPFNFDNEMQKLDLYLEKGERVTLDLVKNLIVKDPSDDVFDLLNAITSHDRKTAILLYYDLLESGSTSLQILFQIEKKFQEVLYSKEFLIGGATQDDFMTSFGVTKGRAYYMMKNARDISYPALKTWLKRMIDLDYSIKIGKIDQDAGLELLLLKS